MTPLLWVPTLRMAEPNSRTIHRFLRWHGGYGHIVCSRPVDTASLATTAPYARHVLHWEAQSPPPGSPPAIDLTLWWPLGVNAPALQQLADVQRCAPLRRLILKRPAQSDLKALNRSLATLRELWPDVSLWIDQATTGWEALAYLLARQPHLQIESVADQDVFQLADLARAAGRPLAIADWSGRPPRPLPAWPSFPLPDPRPVDPRTLPVRQTWI